MSTVQFSLYVGETFTETREVDGVEVEVEVYVAEEYTATLHEIDGTVVEEDVEADEVVPGAFNVPFGTVPNGFYRVVVSDVNGPLFTDTVVINSANAINVVTGEARVIDAVTVSNLSELLFNQGLVLEQIGVKVADLLVAVSNIPAKGSGRYKRRHDNGAELTEQILPPDTA